MCVQQDGSQARGCQRRVQLLQESTGRVILRNPLCRPSLPAQQSWPPGLSAMAPSSVAASGPGRCPRPVRARSLPDATGRPHTPLPCRSRGQTHRVGLRSRWGWISSYCFLPPWKRFEATAKQGAGATRVMLCFQRWLLLSWISPGIGRRPPRPGSGICWARARLLPSLAPQFSARGSVRGGARSLLLCEAGAERPVSVPHAVSLTPWAPGHACQSAEVLQWISIWTWKRPTNYRVIMKTGSRESPHTPGISQQIRRSLWQSPVPRIPTLW